MKSDILKWGVYIQDCSLGSIAQHDLPILKRTMPMQRLKTHGGIFNFIRIPHREACKEKVDSI